MYGSVRQYYGDAIQGSADLCTDACCTPGAIPEHLKAMLANIHPEL